MFKKEINSGNRFEFGRNWQKFLNVLDDERICQAEKSIKEYLKVDTLAGKTFVDVGSGSGLFSLAARRLGASVCSIDYDPQSVNCTNELKNRYFKDDSNWIIKEGSILDVQFVQDLGRFDIVYSWGVLHHTGEMWKAMKNIIPLLEEHGTLFISLYNYQTYWSASYTVIKRIYNKSPYLVKCIIVGLYAAFQASIGVIKDLIFHGNPIHRYIEKKKDRGMSMWHDWVDWIGGYPFETAKPEEVVDFYQQRGFRLKKLKTCGGGHGCNEYVFTKE
jgi:SAM-dependent methyltransferase